MDNACAHTIYKLRNVINSVGHIIIITLVRKMINNAHGYQASKNVYKR